MLGRLPTALLTALSTVLVSALGGAPPTGPPPTAPPRTQAPADLGWVANLNQGHAVDVAYANGALRLTGPTGLLTLPAHPLPRSVGRLSTQVDASTPPGGTVEVDVRGRLPGGRWTEWLPTSPGAPTELPGPSNLVQLRVLLTADPGAGPNRPEVRALRVHAEEVTRLQVAAPADPVDYRVFATREGLVHGRTANGHRIKPHDLFVALPSWRSLADEDGSEYSVKVCAAGGRCVWAPVWDVGPWNTKDDYWSAHRQEWPDLPQGVPEAEAAYRDGHNDGKDGEGRTVGNPAGIDLSDGVFDKALKLTDNGEVTVSYLWTGGPPLSTVDAENTQTDTADPLAAARAPQPATQPASTQPATPATDSDSDQADKSDSDDTSDSDDHGDGSDDGLSADQAVPVRSAPAPDAPQVGLAANSAGVPVECAAPNGWLRIGPDEYLPAGAVELADDTSVGPC
ncbi:MAG TPA: hypothetical protein VH141_07225 [Pseudonocardia sp.]|nr:hypothetical protein [Pseudonocardia sp.]